MTDGEPVEPVEPANGEAGIAQEVQAPRALFARPVSELEARRIKQVDGPLYTCPQSAALSRALTASGTGLPKLIVPEEEIVAGERDLIAMLEALFERFRDPLAFDAVELRQQMLTDGDNFRGVETLRDLRRSQGSVVRSLLRMVNIDLEPFGMPKLPETPNLAVAEARALEEGKKSPLEAVLTQMFLDGRLEEVYAGLDREPTTDYKHRRILCPTLKMFGREVPTEDDAA